MPNIREKYLNPFTDYGFKKIFGEEPNKDILLDFLNELLKDKEGKITEISYLKRTHTKAKMKLDYLKNEQGGKIETDRKAIFDIYCQNERGERFIVEMQKSKQKFFKDRTVYYATFPIQSQAEKLDWDFELKRVYLVAILDFVFDVDEDNKEKYRYDVKLTDTETHKVFYDKLTFTYLEMPKFTKEADELNTRFEKWLYLIKNLHLLDGIPSVLQEEVFQRVFKIAEVSKLSEEEYMTYEDSLKHYRDAKNILDTAREEAKEEGREEGREEGKAEQLTASILGLYQNDVSIPIIAVSLGITESEVQSIIQNQSR